MQELAVTVRVFIVIACQLTIFGGVNIARLPSTDVQVGGLEGTAQEMDVTVERQHYLAGRCY